MTPFRLAALLASTALTACASTTLDAQWRDPQVPGSYLRGARVLVTCEAGDLTVKKVCEDQLVAELTARGATSAPTSAACARVCPTRNTCRQRAAAARRRSSA